MSALRKVSRLRPHDIAATLIVAVIVAGYWLFQAGNAAPGFGSARTVAAAALGLGLVACGVGGEPDARNRGPASRAIIGVLSALGGAALVIGILAIIMGSEALLTTLVVITVALWVAAMLRHLLTPPAPARPEPQEHTPRTDVFAASNR